MYKNSQKVSMTNTRDKMVDTGTVRLVDISYLKRAVFVLTGFVVLVTATIGINLRERSLIGVFHTDVEMQSDTSQDDQETNHTDLSQANRTVLIPCYVNTSTLEATVNISNDISDYEYDKYTDALKRVTIGGTFTPYNCSSVENVAILVPYRDRRKHLEIFLPYMHRFLQKQSIQYTIFIIEQKDTGLFNRGILMNAGYIAATLLHKFTCFILHDVDLLPTNELNIYGCSNKIKHMSTANSKYNFKLPYPTYFGGVVAIQPKAFQKTNGFSNLYFGWGQEDDDFFLRIKAAGFAYERISKYFGHYESLNHTFYTTYASALIRRKMLYPTARRRMTSEGLNSFDYKYMSYKTHPLYTLVEVETNETVLAQKFFKCNLKGWPCPFKDIT